MKKENHILIFDIGKTNKKVLVFDEAYNVVYQEAKQFEEVSDEEGFPCDDLTAISSWVKERFQTLCSSDNLNVVRVNFSTYGASWVYLNHAGECVGPLYNYLKPFPVSLQQMVDEKYGLARLSSETGSPFAGMLNSVFQLYWIQKCKPGQFSQIQTSLHFPQYISYLFTQEKYSEYTSIGCHTALWDFKENNYHKWVYEEGLDQVQAPIVNSGHLVSLEVHGKRVDFGPGIHDSSAALLPYIKANSEPFVLLSTGTWNVALNPFTVFEESFSADVLYYKQIDGSPVKATRLFMGNEHDFQVRRVSEYFNVKASFLLGMEFSPELYSRMEGQPGSFFRFESLQSNSALTEEKWTELPTVEMAYHRLVYDLVQLQVIALNKAMATTTCYRVFVDGGFTKNDVFMKMLACALPKLRIFKSKTGIVTAVGAALVLDKGNFSEGVFRKIFDIDEVIVK